MRRASEAAKIPAFPPLFADCIRDTNPVHCGQRKGPELVGSTGLFWKSVVVATRIPAEEYMRTARIPQSSDARSLPPVARPPVKAGGASADEGGHFTREGLPTVADAELVGERATAQSMPTKRVRPRDAQQGRQDRAGVRPTIRVARLFPLSSSLDRAAPRRAGLTEGGLFPARI
jgi:hypothetical protein